MNKTIMYRVNSSNISYMGYDARRHILYVKFKNRAIYRYDSVGIQKWRELQVVISKGSALHWKIKTKGYTYSRTTDTFLEYSLNHLPFNGIPHPYGYKEGEKLYS